MEDNDEQCLSDTEPSQRRRRSSFGGILKTPKANKEEEEEKTEVVAERRKSRRVSFASSNFVKPFASDPDKVTLWDTTYEEAVNHTDSTQSSQGQVTTESKISFSSTCSLNKIEIWTAEEELVKKSTSNSDKNGFNSTFGANENKENFTKPDLQNTIYQSDMDFTKNVSGIIDENIPKSFKNTNVLDQASGVHMDLTNAFDNKENLPHSRKSIHFNQSSSGDMEFTKNLSGIISENIEHMDINDKENFPRGRKTINFNLSSAEDMEFTKNLSGIISENVAFANKDSTVLDQNVSMDLTNVLYNKEIFPKNENTIFYDQSSGENMEFTKNLSGIISENIPVNNKNELSQAHMIHEENQSRRKTIYFNQSLGGDMEFTKNLSSAINENISVANVHTNASNQTLGNKENLHMPRKTIHFNQSLEGDMELTKNLSSVINENISVANVHTNASNETHNNKENLHMPRKTINFNQSLEGDMEFTKNLSSAINENISVANVPTNVSNQTHDNKENLHMPRKTIHFNQSLGEDMEFTKNLSSAINENISVANVHTNASNQTLGNKENLHMPRKTIHFNQTLGGDMEFTKNLSSAINENISVANVHTNASNQTHDNKENLHMPRKTIHFNQSLGGDMEFTKNLSGVISENITTTNKNSTILEQDSMDITKAVDNKENLPKGRKTINFNQSLGGDMEFTKNLSGVISEIIVTSVNQTDILKNKENLPKTTDSKQPLDSELTKNTDTIRKELPTVKNINSTLLDENSPICRKTIHFNQSAGEAREFTKNIGETIKNIDKNATALEQHSLLMDLTNINLHNSAKQNSILELTCKGLMCDTPNISQNSIDLCDSTIDTDEPANKKILYAEHITRLKSSGFLASKSQIETPSSSFHFSINSTDTPIESTRRLINATNISYPKLNSTDEVGEISHQTSMKQGESSSRLVNPCITINNTTGTSTRNATVGTNTSNSSTGESLNESIQEMLSNLVEYEPMDFTPHTKRMNELIEKAHGLIKSCNENLIKMKSKSLDLSDLHKLLENTDDSEDDDVEVQSDQLVAVKEELAEVNKKYTVTSLHEKIVEASERCNENWILQDYDIKYIFRTLFSTLEFIVEFDPVEGQVKTIETKSNLKDCCKMSSKLTWKLFADKLQNAHLESLFGTRYDILTLLDYVDITFCEIVKFHEKILEYERINDLQVTPDYIVKFKIQNVRLVIWWNLTVDFKNIYTISPDDVTATREFRRSKMDEQYIKNLSVNCPKGLQFLDSYMEKLNEYVDVLLRRRNFKDTKNC